MHKRNGAICFCSYYTSLLQLFECLLFAFSICAQRSLQIRCYRWAVRWKKMARSDLFDFASDAGLGNECAIPTPMPNGMRVYHVCVCMHVLSHSLIVCIIVEVVVVQMIGKNPPENRKNARIECKHTHTHTHRLISIIRYIGQSV